jgi:hypothetical protein
VTPSPIPQRDARLKPGEHDAALMDAAFVQAQKS